MAKPVLNLFPQGQRIRVKLAPAKRWMDDLVLEAARLGWCGVVVNVVGGGNPPQQISYAVQLDPLRKEANASGLRYVRWEHLDLETPGVSTAPALPKKAPNGMTFH